MYLTLRPSVNRFFRFAVSIRLRAAKDCHCDPVGKRGKQSPVIPVETGIQEGRIAVRPYRIASSFHSSQ
jgi:hypothetical protein